MENETITLKCTSCGKEIQIPADLESFSCLYCGAKHRMADYRSKAEAEIPATLPADEADRAYAEKHLLDCIRNYPNYFKRFNRKKYEPAYRAHREDIRETFEAMDRYVCAMPAQREKLVESFVDAFLAQWEEYQSSQKKMGRKRREFADKLTLAWFTVPAIRSLDLSIGEDFLPMLRDRFNEKYPDNRFELGSFAEINGGFRKHGFCFVTTAVCEAEGKADDCEELTAFRAFRDGWLAQTEAGRNAVAEYYETAPAVVAAMRYGDDETARCAELRRDWLEPCYEALLRGDNESCERLYTQMMRSLRARYFLS